LVAFSDGEPVLLRLKTLRRNRKPMPDQETRERRIRDEDGLWTALALFVTVLVFLGTAAYLYWWGAGKLPWQ
jgi:hypothetical protein